MFHFPLSQSSSTRISQVAGEATSWQQRRPRGLSVTCRAQTKSPLSLRGKPSKASEKRFSRCERRCMARQRRQTRKGGTERMDGLTNGQADRQTDMRERMKIIILGVPLGYKCQQEEGRKAGRSVLNFCHM